MDWIILTGIFLFFLAGVVWLATGLRHVRARKAFVILNRFNGSVKRVVNGPRLVIVLPFFEEVWMMERSVRMISVNLDNVSTCDQMAVGVKLDVSFILDLSRVPGKTLDQILPLLDTPDGIVEGWAKHILSALVIRFEANSLLSKPEMRARLERQFLETLKTKVQGFGVQIYLTRLTLYPAPSLQKAYLDARARTQLLNSLKTALGSDGMPGNLIELEMMDGLLQGKTDMVTAVNVTRPGSPQRPEKAVPAHRPMPRKAPTQPSAPPYFQR